jgi:hypothetical protein
MSCDITHKIDALEAENARLAETLEVRMGAIDILNDTNARLRSELESNAAMLARQCDLAREAEAEAMSLRSELEKARGSHREPSVVERCVHNQHFASFERFEVADDDKPYLVTLVGLGKPGLVSSFDGDSPEEVCAAAIAAIVAVGE